MASATLKPSEVKKFRKWQKRRRMGIMADLAQLMTVFLIVMLVCLMWPFALDSIDLPDIGTGLHQTSTQTSLVQAYASYLTQKTGAGPATAYDSSAWYVDAMGKVEFTESAVSTILPGLTVGNGTPTQELTDGAYICNVWDMVGAMYSDIVDYEEASSATSGFTDEAKDTLINDKMSLFFSTAEMGCFGPENGDGPSVLGGAVGSALLDRQYYDNKMWATTNVSQNYWTGFPNGYGDGTIDIMMCHQSKLSEYMSGGAVDITYVAWNVNDAKNHAAPWGLGQTFIRNNCDDGAGLLETNAAGSMYAGDNVLVSKVRLDGTNTTYEAFASIMDSAKQSGKDVYWAPHLRTDKASFPTRGSTSAGYSGNLFEHRKNEGWNNFVAWLNATNGDDPLVVVGVLVYKNVT